MRLVKYDVRTADGTIVTMTSYPKAMELGKIVKTYLVPVGEDYFMTEKEKEEKAKRDLAFRKKLRKRF